MYSLPYSAINMWSSENAGRMLDFNAEIELWTRAGHVKVKVNKGVDIRKLDNLISSAVSTASEGAQSPSSTPPHHRRPGWG